MVVSLVDPKLGRVSYFNTSISVKCNLWSFKTV